MQAIMEIIFDVMYLCMVITLGIRTVMGAGERKQMKLFGIMAVTLGCGDAFHLVSRAYTLCTDGLASHAMSLGFSRFVTSVTVTVSYVILYCIWRQRYEAADRKELTMAVYALAIVRTALRFMSNNDWLSASAPLSWGIYRNIPFTFLGLLMIVLFYRKTKEIGSVAFRYMWLAITLSLGFYIPVVLWADAYPLIDTLMIPKICAYMWMVWMGCHGWKKNR